MEKQVLQKNSQSWRKRETEVIRGGAVSRTTYWRGMDNTTCWLMHYPSIAVAFPYTCQMSDGTRIETGRGKTAKQAYGQARYFWRIKKRIASGLAARKRRVSGRG